MLWRTSTKPDRSKVLNMTEKTFSITLVLCSAAIMGSILSISWVKTAINFEAGYKLGKLMQHRNHTKTSNTYRSLEKEVFLVLFVKQNIIRKS